MAKRKVLIFTNSFRIGGSEWQAIQLIKHLDRSRFDIRVACFDREGPLLAQLPQDIGEVVAFPLKGFARFSTLRQAAKFIAFLRGENIQILQTFDYYTNVFGLPLARLASVLVTVGSRRDHGFKRTVGEACAERWSLRLARQVVVNAEAIKQRLVDESILRANRIRVILNGIDFSLFPDIRESCQQTSGVEVASVVFAVVANLRPEKGHLTFVHAAKIVLSVCPEARFALIGEGIMRRKIEDLIAAIGLQKEIELRGAVTNIPLALQSVDVVVSPSDTEGFPNAVLEGMTAAKPIVATDVGGTGELVMEGVTGYLVSVGDAESLARRMIMLCQDPALRRDMGKRARNRAKQNFGVENMARRFELLYEELSVSAGI